MTTLYASGMELAPLEWVPAAWGAGNRIGGAQCSSQTTTKRNGTGAVKCDGTVASANAEFGACSVGGDYYDDIMFYTAFYADGVPAGTAAGAGGWRNWFTVGLGSPKTGTESWWFLSYLVDNGSGQMVGKIYGPSDNDSTVTTTSTISTGAWHDLQVHIYCPGGKPAQAAITRGCLVEVKLDDTLVYSKWQASQSLGPNSGQYEMAPTCGTIYSSGETLPNMSVYYDDFYASTCNGSTNAGWPGTNLVITDLTPDGAGSNLAYTAWSGTYTAIDEAPEVTDGIRSITAGDKEAWTYGTATVSGIRSVSQCNTIGIFGAANTNRATIGPIIWDGAEYDDPTTVPNTASSVNAGLASGLRGNCWAYDTRPQTGGSWTQTDIDNLEGGVVLATKPALSDTPNVYTMRAYVLTGTEGPAVSKAGKALEINQAVKRAAFI